MLRVTYIGHATLLITIGGRTFLTDPNFDDALGKFLPRVSAPGIALRDLPKLDAIVKGKALREANLTEKMAVFEAYGGLCGDEGVAALDAMLNGTSRFGRREDSELRAVALGRVNPPRAQESLRRASSEKDVIVRNAVNRALRGGGT